MSAFIAPPTRLPLWLRPAIWLSEKITGRRMLPARLLAWYPKAAIGSGVLEALVAHGGGRLDEGVDARLLKLVRLQASYAARCPFCIDMNGYQADAQGITLEESAAMYALAAQIQTPPAFSLSPRPETAGLPASFSERERLALEYACLVSATPLSFPPEFIARLKACFTEREIVILASTAAQVNYWARLIQALGIPPAGYAT
jgi:AhpD family alkylhydroperoxidase